MTKLSEEVIGYLDDLKFPPTKGTITYWSRQIALLEADCRHYNDESNTALNSVAELEDRIKELEAELSQCLDCCKRVGKLEDVKYTLSLQAAGLLEENAGLREKMEFMKRHMLYVDYEHSTAKKINSWFDAAGKLLEKTK